MPEPAVIAEVTNTVYFANANRVPNNQVDPAILCDLGLYPDAETLSRLFAEKSFGTKALRPRSRTGTRVKSGVRATLPARPVRRRAGSAGTGRAAIRN